MTFYEPLRTSKNVHVNCKKKEHDDQNISKCCKELLVLKNLWTFVDAEKNWWRRWEKSTCGRWKESEKEQHI